jgi:hypothetical protein
MDVSPVLMTKVASYKIINALSDEMIFSNQNYPLSDLIARKYPINRILVCRN